MPLYEYRCEDCGNEFEEMLHFSEREDPINEPCKNMIVIGGHMPDPVRCGGKVHLKMSIGSFHLKGGGWYKDGYSNNKSEPENSGKDKSPSKIKETTNSEKSSTDKLSKTEKKESTSNKNSSKEKAA